MATKTKNLILGIADDEEKAKDANASNGVSQPASRPAGGTMGTRVTSGNATATPTTATTTPRATAPAANAIPQQVATPTPQATTPAAQHPAGGMMGARLADGNEPTKAYDEQQATSTTTAAPPTMGYVPPRNDGEIINYINQQLEAKRPESEEAKKKRERREKRERILAGITDAVQAASNLFFTTRGALDSYQPRNALSDKAKERRDKALKEREANNDYYYKLLAAKKALDDGDRDWRFKLQQADEARAQRDKDNNRKDVELGLKVAADKREEALQPDKVREQKGKADTAESTAKYTPYVEQSKINANNGRAASGYASANASNARAAQIRQETATGGKSNVVLTLHDGHGGKSYDVSIPKSKWNTANISHLYWILGGTNVVKDDNGTTRRPTDKEMEEYIGMALQIGNTHTARAVDKALEYIEGLSNQ